ncbi:hypothetical protein DTO164E3_3926 [Paecilomyces variotii]|uniref:Uncharacterized protein n=1 Tax=Byssochlamys spectabilis TaxID=264951 RepID=A0A443I744_BYSSP|nr:hypothetical protein C8Q69DRAFT_440934 [Paecilomyces variotii]KAJ9198018.1 hypothetical protein DTO032I3_5714 [Paecilomyces variotii]KAJ9200776.1 hypothetical protein DTO164E3_3926 [Paecilomyces variotii]KAJ9276909.1 hypothetical protein DTO021D3_6187 [Paecilomyces variotii]KAJ9290882.1 hypothetical protein DTO021C3_1476 [Paecilomyces variotii]KAJ9309228.1 hypothetical protein DTO217A2_1166 [Paecilomyces variotii]
MSSYALPLRGGSVASPYVAGYDYGPRRSQRYPPEGPLYGGVYPQRVPYRPRPVRAAPRHRKREPDVRFEDAMSRLHVTLTDAVNFFKDFDGAFAHETSGIKSYATGPILDKLWQRKILPDKANEVHSARRTSNEGSEGDEGSTSGQQEEAFRDHLSRVHDDMSQAARSRGPGISRSDMDSLGRLRELLMRQYDVLHGISNKVYTSRKYLQEFIKEAEFFRDYMDKTRELWDFGHDRTEKGNESDEGSQEGSNPEETAFGD